VIEVLSIRDLEKVSGVPRTTIHYYLRQGLLPRPQKTAASRSLYTEDHVRILQKIAQLKRAGLSIIEIENELQPRVDEANEATVDLVAQEHDRVHNRILALAAHEFAAKGYKNTHVTSIMRKLGITATLFYGHFPSKRALLAECVTVLVNWSLTYVDSKKASLEDPAERLLWQVFGHSHVFDLGLAALAVIRVEGSQNNVELRKSIEEGLAVERIKEDLTHASPPELSPAVPDELLALSLFGAYEQTAFRSFSGKSYSRKDLLRTHLWLFLAAQAARNGEIDIDSRLARYDKLITQLATEMPPLPPALQL
jgi:DNA-binding transcriptional MerR regulator